MNYKFGVDYYPEHWPEERLEKDAALMHDLGIDIVRMAEFSWVRLEPAEAEFNFSWLDKAIEVLAAQGIKTILGTPSAAPPAWIIEKSPEILPVDENGLRLGFGGRHHDCQSSRVYRKHVKRILTAMAVHFSKNKNVAGWQIDNELGNSHEELCMCASCENAFRDWLKQRYGTIDKLNYSWGTVFWSQTYASFEQVPAPRRTPNEHSPSLLLNWKRFCSELIVDFAAVQAEIIRKHCPGQFITHNLMGIHPKTDYFKLSKILDFVSNDQYPTGYYFESPQEPSELAAYLDFMRSLKQKNFWMMELEAGAAGGRLIGAMPRPGQLRLWTLQSIAHGADTVVYFRWRTCLSGSEQYWHGILPHSGIPGRRYWEIKETIGAVSGILDDIRGIVTRSEAAILYDYDDQWAFQIQPLQPQLSYLSQCLRYYTGFYNAHAAAEFTGTDEKWGHYRLLMAPLSLLMNEDKAEKMKEYVREGGNLLLTMRSGIKDSENVCIGEAEPPCFLQELTGITVKDYDCLIYGGKTAVKWTEPLPLCETKEASGEKWVDLIELHTARPLAIFTQGYYEGSPAVTQNRWGRGSVFYVATEPDDRLMEIITNYMMEHCGLTPSAAAQTGVELTVRKGRKRDYLFAMNHTEEEKTFPVSGKWTPVSCVAGNEDTRGEGSCRLKPYECRIFMC